MQWVTHLIWPHDLNSQVVSSTNVHVIPAKKWRHFHINKEKSMILSFWVLQGFTNAIKRPMLMRDFLWPISNVWNRTWAPKKAIFVISTTHAIQGLNNCKVCSGVHCLYHSSKNQLEGHSASFLTDDCREPMWSQVTHLPDFHQE